MVRRDKRRADLSGNTVLGLALCLMSVASSASGEGSQVYPMTGRVIDDQVRPVEGAEVAAFGWGFSSQEGLTHTDANGQFRFEFSAPYVDLPIVSRKTGLALGWTITTDPCGVTLVLGRPQRLAGMVVDEATRPITGATVRAILYHRNFARWRGDMSDGMRGLALREPEDWLTTRTDTEGRFCFDSIPAGSFADFQVSAPSRARLCTHRGDMDKGYQFAAGRSDIRVVLNPEAVIQGQVVDEDSGRPVSGVSVAIVPKGPHAECNKQGPVASNEMGTFSFKGLAEGTYVLRLNSETAPTPAWVGKGVEVAAKAGQVKEDIRIPVNKGGILEVLVRDLDSGDPISGATVCVRQGSDLARHTYESPTDANGVARFRLSVGEARICSGTWKERLGTLFSHDQPVTIDKGKTQRCTVDLPHNWYPVSGRVLDPNGRPLEGAWVHSGSIRVTDKEGRFKFANSYWDTAQYSWQGLARHESLGLAVEATLRDPDNAGRYPRGDITLRPASTITGQVTDPQGRPVRAADVLLLRDWGGRRIAETVTDANGAYRFAAMPASLCKIGRLTLVARAQGYGTREVPGPKFADADRVVRMDPIMLEPATESISGVVVDGNDRPVPGALLCILGPDGHEDLGQPFGHVIADDRGRFRGDDVCKGPLRLSVAGGYLDAWGGASDLKVVLGRQRVHTGQKPLVGRSVGDLREVGVMCDPNEFKDKSLLVCFIDVGQRPSRNLAQQLSKREVDLKAKDVSVFLVQAEPTTADTLTQQGQGHGISMPIYCVPGDPGKVRNAWNVRSLPWLLLTDRNHVVRAEGLGLDDLDRLTTR